MPPYPSSSASSAVALHDLTAGYGSHAAIHHVTGDFAPGSLTAIVGPNGSGKSTLLKTIAGLLAPMSGRCSTSRQALAYLPQISELDRAFPARVRDLVALGLWQRRGLLGRHRAEDRARITDALAQVLIGLVLAVTALSFGLLWRALVAECLDPLFLRSVSGIGTVVHFGFLSLVVLNLVAGFQALGTLLAVGLMILPAAAARFWTQSVRAMVALAVGIGAASSASGLLLSYHLSLPSGPSITLSAGAVYLLSVLAGPRGLLLPRLPRRSHRTA